MMEVLLVVRVNSRLGVCVCANFLRNLSCALVQEEDGGRSECAFASYFWVRFFLLFLSKKLLFPSA